MKMKVKEKEIYFIPETQFEIDWIMNNYGFDNGGKVYSAYYDYDRDEDGDRIIQDSNLKLCFVKIADRKDELLK